MGKQAWTIQFQSLLSDGLPIIFGRKQTACQKKKKIKNKSGTTKLLAIQHSLLSLFLIGRMFVRKPSWEYSVNLAGS